jgi:GDPmannose 4,6-dehydratase
MLQQDKPEDFTISTGKQYSVRDFVNVVAKELNIELKWRGHGIDETGIDMATGKIIICVDSRYFRPTEVKTLLGDSRKAEEKLGWKPKISFEDMVKEMVSYDLNEAEKDSLCNQKGFLTYNYQE